jgi:hypothetical protein
MENTMFTCFYGRDFSFAISRLILLSFVVLLPFVVGCGEDDNPIVDEHDHEEGTSFHADADGFVLEVDGSETYRQFQGTETGGLTVAVGKEIEVHVAFLDASGVEIHVAEGEDEHEHGEEEEIFTLGLTGYDLALIDIHLSEEAEEHDEEEHDEEEHDEEEHDEEEHGEEEHDEEAQWRFEVVGLKAGTTQITLQLLHGDHPDFTAALPIPVTVQ